MTEIDLPPFLFSPDLALACHLLHEAMLRAATMAFTYIKEGVESKVQNWFEVVVILHTPSFK